MITKLRWSERCRDFIKVSAGADIEWISNEISSGVSELWECREGDKVLHVVTRIEPGELVIVCGEGRGMDRWAPMFIDQAASQGLKIRTHVKRAGMVRKWKKHGVTLSEYVLRN